MKLNMQYTFKTCIVMTLGREKMWLSHKFSPPLSHTYLMHALQDQNLSGSFLLYVAAGCRRIRELLREERHV